MYKIKRKKWYLVLAVIICCFAVAFSGLYAYRAFRQQALSYSREYTPGVGNIKGDLDAKEFTDISDKFAIGANSYGYAVFKDPNAAWREMKRKYGDGIRLIQTEFHLNPLTKGNYGDYKTYGWQVTTGTEKEQEEAAFVTGFMDIYENSQPELGSFRVSDLSFGLLKSLPAQ